MKILTANQMQEVDRLTTERAGVPSLTLMENAGRHVAEFLLELDEDPGRITILCGKGNNGGDGFVAARHLRARGVEPQVALLAKAESLRGDARANYEAYLEAGGEVHTLPEESDWQGRCTELLQCDWLVDALLGTGLSGPPRGLVARVVRDVLERRGNFRMLAVDIPSGMSSDSGRSPGAALEADACVTFTAPKLAHVFPPNCLRCGQLAVGPIGTPDELMETDEELFLSLITRRQLSRLPLAREADTHKGSYGHVLLVAGSRGKTGAAGLAGRSALRAGAGLVTVAVPESQVRVVASFCPDYMTEPLAETEAGTVSVEALDYGRFAGLLEGRTVLALGPGLTTHPETAKFVRAVFVKTVLPIILDADALNCLLGGLDVLKSRRAEQVVLTPHPGEMARLLGSTTQEVQEQRVEVARSFAREFGVYVILKGYRTLVAAPDGRVWVNPAGGPALAKAGAGDVLLGVVSGCVAQFRDAAPELPLCLAVYLHGRAGDLASEAYDEHSLLASDVCEEMGGAWRELEMEIGEDRPGSRYLLP